MMFTKRLREGVRRGEIACSVRFWTRPHVRVGARYAMGEGAIEVDSIELIGFPDITPELARESGFLGVLDLLKVAKHGRSEKIYLVRFHYVRSRSERVGKRKSRKMPDFPTQVVGTPTNRGKARRYERARPVREGASAKEDGAG